VDALLDDTNPEQRAAILHDGGPLLVVAGAGSGKTRVITRRVARLVRDGVGPYEVLALTFTNKAAKEMRERVEKLVTARDVWVCTFHGFAARVLRRFGERIGYGRDFTIYDTEDRQSVLKQILKESAVEDITPGELSTAITREKNGLEEPGGPGWRAERMAALIRLYAERMRAANAMDFDDLLLNLLRLLTEDEGARGQLEERARWLLVDEYQDTNAVQYRILRALAGTERNVCATGDPDQSIYRWRGATIRNILDFERDFPGARVLTLDRNYRSTRAILDVANAVIRNNRDRYEKELRTENAQGKAAREVRCGSDEEEALACAREVRAWIASGRRPKDIAIFYRTNAQSRLLERAMGLTGVPYRIVGAVEFYRRMEVKDVLAYVRLARNPRDAGALRRILNVPARGLGATAEERLLEAAKERGVPPREVLRDPVALASFGRARKALEGFAALVGRLEALPADDPAVFVARVIEETGYRRHLGENTPRAETDRLENVDQLVNAAAEYAGREPHGGIDGFLEENALVSDQDAYDGEADAVSLMTVHSAKGLEFPCVAVTGLEEHVLPHALALETPEEIEEERRLFYVAVTRAREELVLLHAARRMQRGQVLPSTPSRFLDEIPEEMLDVLGERLAEEEPVYRAEEDPGFREGDRVRHHHFGLGRVVAVRPGGGGTRVTVEFAEAGRRDLLLSYARLERV
jgi:DNA helicase-2/ATP-dependent DNA helicase PcrA